MAFDKTSIGRFKYRTQNKAEGVADKLGISGFHSHRKDDVNNGNRYYMPGRTHMQLNAALRERGMMPTGASPSLSGGENEMMSDMAMMGSEMGAMDDGMGSTSMMESETSMSMNMGDPDDLSDFSMIGDETDSVGGGLFDKDEDASRATDELFSSRIDTDAKDPDKVGNFKQDSFIIGYGSPDSDDDDDEDSEQGVYST